LTRAKAAATLPAGLEPRGLGREAAAAYLSISPNQLDSLVAAGTIAPPIEVGRRRIWDRFALDNIFVSPQSRSSSNSPRGRAKQWRPQKCDT
jgi:hypothetical protein